MFTVVVIIMCIVISVKTCEPFFMKVILVLLSNYVWFGVCSALCCYEDLSLTCACIDMSTLNVANAD